MLIVLSSCSIEGVIERRLMAEKDAALAGGG
jgi:hypothetical protein